MDNQIKINKELQEATDALAEALLQSEPFAQYRQSNEDFKSDQQAVQLLQEYSKLQQTIRAQQYTQQITKSDRENLRNLQNSIAENQTIQDYTTAQESAILMLREVNLEISQMLGIDFASLTQQPGNC